MLQVINEHYVWDKTDDFGIAPFFNCKEFSCHCSNSSCVSQRISVDLLNRLVNIRMQLGSPLVINSAYRCHEYQKQLAAQGFETAKGVSQHELGNAVDVRAKDMTTLNRLLAREFKALGKANTFIHVDTRNDKQRRWSYTSR